MEVRKIGNARPGVVSYLIVDAEGLIRILDQLVDGKGGVVRLDDSVRDLGGGHDGEGGHHSVWELFADLGDEQGTHTSTGTTTKRVSDLEALKAIAALGLATNDIQNLINKLSALSVVTFGPIVACHCVTSLFVVVLGMFLPAPL